jgi:hypothetical protein
MIENLQIQTLYEDPFMAIGRNKDGWGGGGGGWFKEIASAQIAFVNVERSKP